MANAQHLMYRSDVLTDLGISVPTTYEEMWPQRKNSLCWCDGKPCWRGLCRWLEPRTGIQQHVPWLWRIAFQGGLCRTEREFRGGVNALNMMKALSEYMNPDFLTHDSNATNAEYRAGNIALLNMWGSRAASQTTTEGVTDAVKNGHAIAGPMTVGGGSIPASTLWWDGWSVSKNISDEEAEASFLALMNGIRPNLMADEAIRTQAVWLIEVTSRRMPPSVSLRQRRWAQHPIRCCHTWD